MPRLVEIELAGVYAVSFVRSEEPLNVVLNLLRKSNCTARLERADLKANKPLCPTRVFDEVDRDDDPFTAGTPHLMKEKRAVGDQSGR